MDGSHHSVPLVAIACVISASLSDQQVGSLLLCGLHLLNVHYMLLINVFVLFPLGNKAM